MSLVILNYRIKEVGTKPLRWFADYGLNNVIWQTRRKDAYEAVSLEEAKEIKYNLTQLGYVVEIVR